VHGRRAARTGHPAMRPAFPGGRSYDSEKRTPVSSGPGRVQLAVLDACRAAVDRAGWVSVDEVVHCCAHAVSVDGASANRHNAPQHLDGPVSVDEGYNRRSNAPQRLGTPGSYAQRYRRWHGSEDVHAPTHAERETVRRAMRTLATRGLIETQRVLVKTDTHDTRWCLVARMPSTPKQRKQEQQQEDELEKMRRRAATDLRAFRRRSRGRDGRRIGRYSRAGRAELRDLERR